MSAITATAPSAPDPDAATYRVPQAADRAGVSDRTIWRLVDSKKQPGVIRIGRSVRISRKLFDAWIDGAK